MGQLVCNRYERSALGYLRFWSRPCGKLRACPREHRPVVLHAIWPISIKLYQFKGSTLHSNRQSGFCFGFFRISKFFSISKFDWPLVNQQKQINDCVFRLFDSPKYLTTLRSNISIFQKVTTLILIPLYSMSFHLWKTSKKRLGTTIFLSWMPFKICDCDKFLWTTPVTQFWL